MTRNIFHLAFFIAWAGRFKTHLSFAGPARTVRKITCHLPARWKNHLSSAGPLALIIWQGMSISNIQFYIAHSQKIVPIFIAYVEN